LWQDQKILGSSQAQYLTIQAPAFDLVTLHKLAVNPILLEFRIMANFGPEVWYEADKAEVE
jgi:hypothetical protein